MENTQIKEPTYSVLVSSYYGNSHFVKTGLTKKQAISLLERELILRDEDNNTFYTIRKDVERPMYEEKK